MRGSDEEGVPGNDRDRVCRPLGADAQSADSIGPALSCRQPAQEWVEALPIGNGRLGGMVFGGVPEERIQLPVSSSATGATAAEDRQDWAILVVQFAAIEVPSVAAPPCP
jgi:hypothetical protein